MRYLISFPAAFPILTEWIPISSFFRFPCPVCPYTGFGPRSNADYLISKHQRRTRRRVGLPRAVDLHDLNVGIGEHGGCASHKIAEECGAERHVRRENRSMRQRVYHADIVRRLPRSRNHRGDRSAICKIAHLAGRARVGEVDHAVCAFPDIGKRACRFDPARKRFPRGKRIRCTRKPGIANPRSIAAITSLPMRPSAPFTIILISASRFRFAKAFFHMITSLAKTEIRRFRKSFPFIIYRQISGMSSRVRRER